MDPRDASEQTPCVLTPLEMEWTGSDSAPSDFSSGYFKKLLTLAFPRHYKGIRAIGALGQQTGLKMNILET